MAQDKKELKIHEKLKQMYTYLARVLYVENDPISIGIDNKKRCYVWQKLKKEESCAHMLKS